MAKEIITPNSAVKPDDANAYRDKGLHFSTYLVFDYDL